MTNIVSRLETNLVKELQRHSHAHANELEALLTDAGIITPLHRIACKQVEETCDVGPRARCGRIRRKISLIHINYSFNEGVQINFCVARIYEGSHVIINIANCGTTFGYRPIVQHRSAGMMQKVFKEQ